MPIVLGPPGAPAVSTKQTLATQQVYDYIYDTKGNAIPNLTVSATLQYGTASVTSPIVNIGEVQQNTQTDTNGYFTFNLVPNANLTPTGTSYTIKTPYNAYDISVPATSGPFQSSAILVNTPAVLTTAATGLVGPITITGNETVTGNLTVNGNTSLAGTTTGALSTTGNLSVTGSTQSTGNITAVNNQSGGIYVDVNNTIASGHEYRIYSTGTANGPVVGAFDIFDGTASADRFTILPGGNVGIGTVTPSTLLQVAGTVTANAVTSTGVITGQGLQSANVGSFTSNGRFLGVLTVSGAPSSGTYNTGDYGYDVNGVLYFNTAGGSPGTWKAVTGWIKWSRTLINPAVPDTSSLGDIALPSGFNHAMFEWVSQDTSANTNSSFGSMQVALGGGAIDTTAVYQWADVNAQNNPSGAPTSSVGASSTSWAALATAGGAVGSQYWNSGTIWLHYYSRTDLAPRATWQYTQINPSDAVTRSGSGYKSSSAPFGITKVRFTTGSNNFAVNTTFDLFVSP